MTVERLRLPVQHTSVDTVSAAVHTPAGRQGPSVLLTHSAGGDLDAPGLVALAEVLAGLGHRTVRVNLPFREAGQRAAPRADRSVAPLRHVVEEVRAHFPGETWVLGGRSYGGRVASMAVADGLDALGLLFYSYPLHPPGKPEKLRVSHWPSIRVRCLFLQGDHDPFCDLDLLDEHLTKLPRRATLHVVEGGDHGLEVKARNAPDGVRRRAPEVIADLRGVLANWLASLD